MQIPTLPRVAYTATTPLILCSAHDSDVPATCEDYYVVDPGSRDERGASLARCGDEKCRRENLQYISCVGDYTETVPLTQAAALASAAA